MANYYSNKLVIIFLGDRNGIGFSKSIIRVLGYPSFISIKVTEDFSSLAVVPCEAKEVLSFRVPEKLFERKPGFRIYSQKFLDTAMSVHKLERKKSYQCVGHYNEEQNAVVFTLADMKPTK